MASHKALNSYYMNQAQGNHPAYYIGPSFQKGHGLGGIFSSLFRAAVPIFKTVSPVLKQGAKAVAREAISTGAQIASDALKGDNWKESAAKRTNLASQRLINMGAEKLDAMLRPPPKYINSNRKRTKSIKASRNVKRTRRDIFD